MPTSDGGSGSAAATEAAPLPLCFVLMPFGRKADNSGTTINFDDVYQELIAPAVRAANLEPIRADEELAGGIVHKAMFERLMCCPYAVADLTFANANVYYELGVRHAVLPHSTLLIFAEETLLPFDLALARGLPYSVDARGAPAKPAENGGLITQHLIAARHATVDSPVFQLVDGFPDLSRLKTDVFRDRVQYSAIWKERLAEARTAGLPAVKAAEAQLGNLQDVEGGTVIDLFLSYRAVQGYDEMVALVDRMPLPLARTAMVREQHGLALNRLGLRRRAETVLLDLVKERGPSSETYGILGRVYKDMWDDARKAGQAALARGLVHKAIGAYLAGFEADWRDAYPGINVLTLMEVADPPDERRHQILPVVRYAVERRLATADADYWDFATRLELAVLARDEQTAYQALAHALANARESWERESTANNLRLIRQARERRNDDVSWSSQVEQELRTDL